MELQSIINEVNKIFIDVFEDRSIVLTENTTNNDIAAWDSLNHIQVITAVEKYFGISFKINELLNFNNVGDMCRCILQKLTSQQAVVAVGR